MKTALKGVPIVIASILIGCHIGPNVNKFNSKSLGKLKERASFDLNCDESKLSINEIEHYRGGYVRTVGVAGCGKRATYIRETDQWIMNNLSED